MPPAETSPASETAAVPGHLLCDVHADKQSLAAALHGSFGSVKLQDNGSCWDMHKAAHSGSQEAAEGRVAASQVQIAPCFIDVNNILRQHELR